MTARLVAIVVLGASYAAALLVSRCGRRVRPPLPRPVRSVLLTGRFDNPGWFRAHTEPLRRAGVAALVVVGDARLAAEPPLRVESPPAWLRILGPAVARSVWLLVTALRSRPDLVMGFHLFPGAISALFVARLIGRPACYQMTGGEIEILGGGVLAENAVMARLGRRSALVERLAVMVVREFDLVVVRGGRARAFLRARGIEETVTINTAGIRETRAGSSRPYDAVFVGRLTAIKRPDVFVTIMARLRDRVPGLRAVIVGDGPLRSVTRARIAEQGLGAHITVVGQVSDIRDYVRGAKVFVLPSRSEGLSISAAEAMAAGAVPVVSDVGELRDLVADGVNGYLVPPADVSTFADRVAALLLDEPLRARLSAAARAAALGHAGLDAVAARWRRDLGRLEGRRPAADRVERVAAG